MAARTSRTTRRRTTSTRRRATGRTTTRRTTTRRRRTGGGSGLGLLAVLWLGLAGAVGWLVRAVGRQAATAKELDPEHRRDGAGLFLLALAILLAVAVWFDGGGPVGEGVATV